MLIPLNLSATASDVCGDFAAFSTALQSGMNEDCKNQNCTRIVAKGDLIDVF